ncbi:unnamed protein product, partial [Prorocentrum cordatum]
MSVELLIVQQAHITLARHGLRDLGNCLVKGFCRGVISTFGAPSKRHAAVSEDMMVYASCQLRLVHMGRSMARLRRHTSYSASLSYAGRTKPAKLASACHGTPVDEEVAAREQLGRPHLTEMVRAGREGVVARPSGASRAFRGWAQHADFGAGPQAVPTTAGEATLEVKAVGSAIDELALESTRLFMGETKRDSEKLVVKDSKEKRLPLTVSAAKQMVLGTACAVKMLESQLAEARSAHEAACREVLGAGFVSSQLFDNGEAGPVSAVAVLDEALAYAMVTPACSKRECTQSTVLQVGFRSTVTQRDTCLPAPVFEKKVLRASPPPPMFLSEGTWPSGWMKLCGVLE